jgi:hypothetical protein
MRAIRVVLSVLLMVVSVHPRVSSAGVRGINLSPSRTVALAHVASQRAVGSCGRCRWQHVRCRHEQQLRTQVRLPTGARCGLGITWEQATAISNGRWMLRSTTAVISMSLILAIIGFRSSPRTGTFVARWGSQGGPDISGSGDGEFNDPRSLGIDGAGNVYVADTGNTGCRSSLRRRGVSSQVGPARVVRGAVLFADWHCGHSIRDGVRCR